MRSVKAPSRFEVKAPEKAPNVVIVLIDDIGFGEPAPFGGPIRTPTLDRLAAAGLRYNNFHTTALCSPTRVTLRIPRQNHHTANTGSNYGDGDGLSWKHGPNPQQRRTLLAEMLRLNGYSTAAFGKWHETAALGKTSVSGPFDRWPTHQGFDKFYGFIGGETDQWYPLIYDGVTRVAPPKMANYHFTTDMTNQAINWVKAQQSMTPDKPFFVYYATGAVHAPHHVPRNGRTSTRAISTRAGTRFDTRRSHARSRWGSSLRAPDSPRSQQTSKIGRRCPLTPSAVHAPGRGVRLDSWSRPITRLDGSCKRWDIGAMDNTLFIYIAGDNGTSAEGGFVGMYNEMTYFNQVVEQVEDLLPLIDTWGGPQTFPHMAAGWAVAFDAPFSWTKQVASDFGGTRNGMVMHWPNGIKDKGGLRSQFGHVIDIAPTVLEAATLPEPTMVNGTPQTPIEGVSLLYTFNEAMAKERHTTQYFEMFGNRAIYHDGWFARTLHRASDRHTETVGIRYLGPLQRP